MIMFFIVGGTGLGTLTAVIGGDLCSLSIGIDCVRIGSSSPHRAASRHLLDSYQTIFTVMTFVRTYRSGRADSACRPEGRARARLTSLGWITSLVGPSPKFRHRQRLASPAGLAPVSLGCRPITSVTSEGTHGDEPGGVFVQTLDGVTEPVDILGEPISRER